MRLDTGGIARSVTCCALALFLAAGAAAQTPTEEAKPGDAKPAEVYQMFYLANVSQQSDMNDVQTALRNTLPRAKVYGAPFQNAILVRATAEDLKLAKQVVADLDRPRKIYRLTYTISETDGGKHTGAQHLTLIANSGEKADLKQGNRVPLLTGSADSSGTTPGTPMQFVQYIDVGENIEARLDGAPEGLRLHTKLEQSSVADEKSGLGVQDPVIRQTALEMTTVVTPGKSLVLGSFDVPGGTLHREVEVIAEVLN